MALLNALMRHRTFYRPVCLCVAFALFLVGTLNLHAQLASAREYQIKAVFLFNFGQFVEWPADSFPEILSPLVIGILGEDPFDGYLDEIVRGEKVAGHPLVVQRYRELGEIKTCHILFISRSEAGKLRQIINGLRGRSILAVSDISDFTEYGGTIRFVTESNKIRLRVNLDAVKAANLIISSKLLRPAEIVTSSRN